MVNQTFSPKIQPIYEKLIGCDNPIEQIQAVYELGNLSSEEDALEAILRGLLLPDSDIKLAILDILMQPEFFGEAIVQPIIDLLGDEDMEVRKQAIEILGMTKDNRAVPPLISSLHDKEPDVRYCAMASLANIGDKNASSHLESCIDSDNWQDRYYAIDSIGMIANPAAAGSFLKAFNDENPKVRENAALSAGFYDRHPEVKAKLIELLDDEELEVQGAAAFMLGEYKCKDAVPQLCDFLKTDTEDLILIAIESLSKIRDPTSISALIGMLDHGAPEISIAAQEALDVFRNIVIIEPLVDALKHDVIVRYIEHRLRKFPEQPGKKKNPERSLSSLKLPMWLEMLLHEILINGQEN
ncbi:hypothetical protein NEF87_001194 [Candidatus Lokiarchaeum ossiferum]|uniref:HEAT repeat domain-containing protein n=1 Tax=Candidatus Lokiarchaeum ossiferum TaxID=2951803 RepID=A0ABY6HR02_9ARCH|nr:hypothetical protein NEF87_001194 [Candidatus Lokiarchaeum sp. B-35]